MMTTNWYWAEEGEQRGPLPEEDLRNRFLAGELPAETLVWSDGMAGWAPASRVPGLTEAAPPPPPPPAVTGQAVAAAGAASSSAPQAGPSIARPTPVNSDITRRAWSRMGARLVDMNLAFAFAASVMGVPNLDDMYQTTIVMLVGFVLWTFIEPVFLLRSGMTPGKWLFRIRIVHSENRFLSYTEGLKRTVQAIAMGLGLGLPILFIVMPALAYRELTTTGSTPWDRNGGFVVQYGAMTGLHKGILMALVLMLLVATFAQPATG